MHHKHPPLTKPQRGHYHRSEWAIYGSTCSAIEALVQQVRAELPARRLVYVDADHHVTDLHTSLQVGKKQFTIDDDTPWNDYDDRLLLPHCEAALVNGNHYPAQQQIILINPEKEASLRRRENQLTQLFAVLVQESESEIYPFVRDRMSADTLVLRQDQTAALAAAIDQAITAATPPLSALVLAGGESQRMGTDKTQIQYHQKTQEIHMADLCADLGLDVYLSKAGDHDGEAIDGYPVLRDRFVGLGPFGAILTAMLYDPNRAWLVVASDLPYLEGKLLRQLIENRSPCHYATAVRGESKPFPEPLVTIYEPSAYPRLLDFLTLGYACPRKMLINSDIEELVISDECPITNVNTPTERQAAHDSINRP